MKLVVIVIWIVDWDKIVLFIELKDLFRGKKFWFDWVAEDTAKTVVHIFSLLQFSLLFQHFVEKS